MDGEDARLLSTGSPAPGKAVLLFDGVCLLCSAFIHFVIDHDPAQRFHFAPLQSDVGRDLLLRWGIKGDLTTVVLIDESGVHTRSTAALRVLLHCGKPWSLLYAFICLPQVLRDCAYKLVAMSRYRVFGQSENVCRRMTKDMKTRFLAV